MKKKVSCHIITYNQKNFISQCIDGVLMQQTDFPYEIIIGDDNSTDGTREILIEFKKKYPEIITLNLRQERGEGIPGKENFVSTLAMCKGEYISLCDGDDYWTNPFKLQKQVDFLEQNKDYVLCFHQINILNTDGIIVEDFITNVPDNYETQETLAKLDNYIHTPSVVFRNVIKEFPFEFQLSPIGDYFLYMLLTQHGKLKYLEEKMCVYREGVGIWSHKNEYFKYLNTAFLHALLSSYFKNNNLLMLIFTDRIKFFLKSFENQITTDDLVKLSFTDILQKEIIEILLVKNANLKKEVMFYKSTKNLVFELSQRINRKIWKR